MNTGQCERELKTLVALLIACLFVPACASNSSPSVPGNNQWFGCRTSSAGEGWECHEGELVEPDRIQEPEENPGPAPEEEGPDPQSAIPVSEEQELQQFHAQTVLEAEQDQAFMSSGSLEGDGSAAAKYSVQLAAFTDRDRRDTYLLESPIARTDLILAQDLRSGQTWWLVLYGNYQTYSEAVRAKGHLIEHFGMTNAWIKPL
ncbi:MAG: SPOR domain-containing protein [Pseudomonadales bacterium]